MTRVVRLMLLVSVALGVLLMHTLGHADGADTGLGPSMAASAQMSWDLPDLTGTAARQGGLPHPMPMDSVCLAVLMLAVVIVRLRRWSAAFMVTGQALGSVRAAAGAGERGPPPPLLSLVATRTVVLRN